MLATPAYDFKADVYYIDSLVQTIRLCAQTGIEVHPVFWPGEALLVHARNALVRLALNAKVDAILFVDADQQWDPQAALRLLAQPVDVVGCPVRKKSDREDYNVKAMNGRLIVDDRGLIEVEAIGTGFLKVSQKAMHKAWSFSDAYDHNGEEFRMVFQCEVIDGRLVGEDILFCKRLATWGHQIYLDPSHTITHNGMKQYAGNFMEWARTLHKPVQVPATETSFFVGAS